MKMLHKDGAEAVVNFESGYGRALSKDAFIWWITQTDRDAKTAWTEVANTLKDPTNPGYPHASELMALKIKQRLKR